MNQKELLLLGEKRLKENDIEESYFKAKKLLEFVLKQDSLGLVVNSLEEVEKSKIEKYLFHLEEMVQGKPLQYITNSQEFMGLDFFVDERVLIPQSDTEILVEEAMKVIKNIAMPSNQSLRILDLCTGSGVVGICLAKLLEKYVTENDLKIYGSDISKEALEVANQNAKKHNAKITFIESDMFEKLKGMEFDVIVSNPPYIETEVIEGLSEEVKREPHLALDGGKDGLTFYKRIYHEAKGHLRQGASILMEIGYGQREKVTGLFQEKYQVSFQKDLAGNDRVIKVFKQ